MLIGISLIYRAMMDQLPEDVVLQHIRPRLDYTSWFCVATVNKAWRLLSLHSPPPAKISLVYGSILGRRRSRV